MYTGNIVLLAPSVHALQLSLRRCEDELSRLDIRLNNKSVSIRIETRFKADCCSPVPSDNCELRGCDSLRYLGVMTSSSIFRHSKQSTYRAFNALFDRVCRATLS